MLKTVSNFAYVVPGTQKVWKSELGSSLNRQLVHGVRCRLGLGSFRLGKGVTDSVSIKEFFSESHWCMVPKICASTRKLWESMTPHTFSFGVKIFPHPIPIKITRSCAIARWPRNAPYKWVPWKFSGLPDYAHGYYSQHCSWAFVPNDPMNVPTKFEVRCFIRSWDKRG